MNENKSTTYFSSKSLDEHPKLSTIIRLESTSSSSPSSISAPANSATVDPRTSTTREFHRDQASAVNQELLDASEESFSVLQGMESLVVTEVEAWRKRFFDALGKAIQSTSHLLAQYGIATEMLQISREDFPHELESLGLPPLSIADDQIEVILKANGMEKDERFFPFFPSDGDDDGDLRHNIKSEQKERPPQRPNNESFVFSVSAETQTKLESAPIEIQLQSSRQYEQFSSLLRELRINTRSSNSSSRISQARLLEIADKLNNSARQLLPTALKTFDPVPAIVDLAKALLSDPLGPTKVELGRLQQLVEDIEAASQSKIRDRTGSAVAEHYVLVEEINDEIAQLYRDAMKHTLEGFKDVELAAGDVAEFLANVNRIDASMGALDEALNEQESLVEGAERDLAVLERQAEVRATQRGSETAEFHLESGRLEGELDQLYHRHTSVWNDVLAKLNELHGINDKIGAVKNSVASLVTRNSAGEAKFLREMQAMSRLIAMRKCASASAKKGAEALQATKQFASEMLQLIAKKDPETVRHKLALEHCVKFYDSYSGFVTHLQECAGKKEQRLENSKRLKRSVNFQVEVAGQTFDPQVAKYREQLLGLNDLIASLEGSVKQLQEELHDGEYRKIWLGTIEPELSAANIPFEEPSQRVQHLRLAMLQRQFAAVDAFQKEEQGKLDDERRVVRVMKNLVNQQQQQQPQQDPSLPSLVASPSSVASSSPVLNTQRNSSATTATVSERRALMNQESSLFSPHSLVNTTTHYTNN